MNVLFLVKTLEIGGVEMVTAVLANKLVDEGHQVVIWAFMEGKTTLADQLHPSIPLVYGHGSHAFKSNLRSLRRVLQDRQVNVVINQNGLPYQYAYLLGKASVGLPVKKVAVYHSSPLANGRVVSVDMALETARNPLTKVFLKMKRTVFRWTTSASMRYVYGKSDAYVVLSPSYVDAFKRFTRLRNVRKVCPIGNPVTLDHGNFCYNAADKERSVLFVGRLDNTSKRVSRLVEVWKQVEPQAADWCMRVVGDGPARELLEKGKEHQGLQRFFLEGFRQPSPYYRSASILVMTSEFEGFPLVLAEAMSFGVVPVVYGSFSAVYDIIENGKDGIVLPYNTDGFDPSAMAKVLVELLSDRDRLSQMAKAAIEKSQQFSLDAVYSEWMSLLGQLRPA